MNKQGRKGFLYLIIILIVGCSTPSEVEHKEEMPSTQEIFNELTDNLFQRGHDWYGVNWTIEDTLYLSLPFGDQVGVDGDWEVAKIVASGEPDVKYNYVGFVLSRFRDTIKIEREALLCLEVWDDNKKLWMIRIDFRGGDSRCRFFEREHNHSS